MKAVVFGINGQDGNYLFNLLNNNGVEVIGISRSASDKWISGDIGNFEFVEAQIKKHQPQFIFHFAANSTTRHAALFENHNAISTGTLNILESVEVALSFSESVFIRKRHAV